VNEQLFDIQSALTPELHELAAEWASELAEVPEEELGRFVDAIALEVYRDIGQEPHPMPDDPIMSRDVAVNNIAHLLMLTLKHDQPEMSEAMQYSLPYAFSRLLLERMAAN
jgi:hypothetical protein